MAYMHEICSHKIRKNEGSQIEATDNESGFLNYWMLQGNEAKQIKINQSKPEHLNSYGLT